ncbi:hypothetical protein [Acetivibrio cellulolyticus]|uniref:hypothetical protein n=1 Tax=Acetivibrio cellulolyticus TaxID=35830 RepID=UPI0001E2DEAA|nr:hypothetical protein [Acetivibrio cellulolyticus]
MRKIIYIVLTVVFFAILFSGCAQNNKISDKIIELIDKQSVKDESVCNISIKEVADFEWDKMAIFKVGSSNKEISELLGVQYNDSVDLTSGIIFVSKNKIVYKEEILYNPEIPSKLSVSLDEQQPELNCIVYTPDNAILKGTRKKVDGEYYYNISNIK